MINDDNKTYCPYAWNHFSAQADGRMRLCCNVEHGSFIKDNDGNDIYIDQVTDLLTYYNLDHFKRIRANMLEGKPNSECSLCYDIERNHGQSIRQYAISQYPAEKFKDITNTETSELTDVRINYLDMSWSNKCNLQCRMCSPQASDQLIKEYDDLGFKADNVPGPIGIRLDFKPRWAYEKIMPVLDKVVTKDLERMLVTGGEPLVNNEFYKLCEVLIEQGYAGHIMLSFHTNLTVMPQKWIDILSHFKSVIFKVSIDGVGECYEYIRYPGKWNILKNNIDELSQMIIRDKPNFELEFHSVLSIFNAHGIVDLLNYLATLPQTKRIRRMPHFNYVFGPDHACPTHLPFTEKLRIMADVETWIANYADKFGLRDDKVSILKALIQLLCRKPNDPVALKLVVEKIKTVDNYRGQNTYQNMPWIERYDQNGG